MRDSGTDDLVVDEGGDGAGGSRGLGLGKENKDLQVLEERTGGNGESDSNMGAELGRIMNQETYL